MCSWEYIIDDRIARPAVMILIKPYMAVCKYDRTHWMEHEFILDNYLLLYFPANIKRFDTILSLSNPDIQRSTGLNQGDVSLLKKAVSGAIPKLPCVTGKKYVLLLVLASENVSLALLSCTVIAICNRYICMLKAQEMCGCWKHTWSSSQTTMCQVYYKFSSYVIIEKAVSVCHQWSIIYHISNLSYHL